MYGGGRRFETLVEEGDEDRHEGLIGETSFEAIEPYVFKIENWCVNARMISVKEVQSQMLDKVIEEVSRLMLKIVATTKQTISRLKEATTTKGKLVARARMKTKTTITRCSRAYGRLQIKVWDPRGS